MNGIQLAMGNLQLAMGNRQGLSNCKVPDYWLANAGSGIICLLLIVYCLVILQHENPGY